MASGRYLFLNVGHVVIGFVCVFLLEMVVPEVNEKLLEELEAMGFPKARSTRALHYCGECIAFKYRHADYCLAECVID